MEESVETCTENVKTTQRRRNNCCVPQCSEVKREGNHLHQVPKDEERRKKWAIAIKTAKPLSDRMQVCSRHFLKEDYIPSCGTGQKPNLKRTAVPSQNLPVRLHDRPTPSPKKRKKVEREHRAAKRLLWKENSSDGAPGITDKASGTGDSLSDRNNNSSEIHAEAEADAEWTDLAETNDINSKDQKKLKDVGIQVEAETSTFISNICRTSKKLFSATGLHSLALLNSLTANFDEVAPDSVFGKFNLGTRDRILMTMMKIKLSLSFASLAIIFDINEQTCANYFFDTVMILAKILKCMIFWPEKETVLKNMPKCFSAYKCTRVVLDCYEIPVGKPQCITCRVRTYSHYKKGHTAKISMNITPSGLICKCTAAFGGRASDKVITAHTGIYELCDPGDGIMVDKGYAIDEECLNHMLVLIRPPFLRSNKTFTRAEAVRCAKIARARVHVERVIQRVRNYHILKNKIPWNLVPYLDDFVVIVSALVNLGNPILSRDKF